MADEPDFSFGPVAKPRAQSATKPAADFSFSPSDTRTGASAVDAAEDRKLLDNPPGGGGTWRNAATTVLKGLTGIPGMVGDAQMVARLAHAGIQSLIPGQPGWRQILPELEARHARAREAGFGSPTSEELYKVHVKPVVGEYEPQSVAGRYFRAAGQAAIPAMLTPGLGPVKGAFAGTSAGLAGEAASEFTDNPYIIAGVSAPAAGAPAVLGAVKRALLPAARTSSDLATEAGKVIRKTATDPDKAMADAKARAAAGLSDEPLAEATLDRGHAQAHDAIMTTGHPVLADTMQQRRTAQNQAMGERLGALAPEGADPKTVSAGFLKHLEDLEAQRDRLAAEVATGLAPNEAGAALRANAAAIGERMREGLDRAKAAIDPDGVLESPGSGIAKFAADRNADLASRPYKTRSTAADEIYDIAVKLPETLRFSDLVDFDQSLTAAMKAAQVKGDMAGWQQIRDLKSKVKQAIGETVERQHQAKGNSIADDVTGRVADDNVRLGADRRAVAQSPAGGERQPGTAGPADPAGGGLDAPVHAGPLAAARGAAGEGAVGQPGGAGAAASARGLPADAAGNDPGIARTLSYGTENLDAGLARTLGRGAAPRTGEPAPAGAAAATAPHAATVAAPDAAARLRQFNQDWGTYKDTYSKGEVGKALERDPGGTPKLLDAEVANRAFASGPKGYENAQMWLRAGGESGLARLKDVALGNLQSSLKGKPLDQKALDAWRGKYEHALRAIDDVEPGFSRQFDNAAGARTAVDAFETSAAGKFLKLDNPDTIVAQVGSMMQRADGADTLSTVVQQASTLPDGDAIVAGLRKAGATWLENRFTKGGDLVMAGDVDLPATVNQAKLREFIGKHRNMLDALFEPAAVEQMVKVAEQSSRYSKMLELQGRMPGSPTAPRTEDVKRLQAQMASAITQDIRSGDMNTLVAITAGTGLANAIAGSGNAWHMLGAATLYAGNRAWQYARAKAGLRMANEQQMLANLIARGFASRDVGIALQQKAFTEHGVPNQRAFDMLARALVGAEATIQAEQRNERLQRASGGRVHDVKSAVGHMLRAVEQARKSATKRTEPMLQAHDDVVAKALAIANRSAA